jgi:hypothetical protein
MAESGRTRYDGAWWPRSRDLAQELPALIVALDRGDTQVAHVSFPAGFWAHAPRTMHIGGRPVHLRSRGPADRQPNTMTRRNGNGRVDLLVIAPETDHATAISQMLAPPPSVTAFIAAMTCAPTPTGSASHVTAVQPCAPGGAHPE